MKKYIVIVLLAVSFIISPVFVSAQSTPMLAATQARIQELRQQLISQLLALINQLKQQLSVLQSQQNQQSQSIDITSPRSGDVWPSGETRQISWTSHGFYGNEWTQVDLVGTRYGLANGSQLMGGNGAVTVTMPNDISPDSYRVKISSVNSPARGGTSVIGYSDYFTVTSGSGIPSSTQQLRADLNVFSDKLSSCTKYKTTFVHPLTGGTMEKEILGIIGGRCNYVEQMPNNGKMECKFTESARIASAQYYRDVAIAESAGTSLDVDSNGQKWTYTIDGKVVENPLQEALDSGMCVISGYR
jgi:hypothetical protein